MMDQDETNLAGEEVSIYDGDTFVGNAPVVDGRWQYTVPSLALGGHDFNARVGPLMSDRWSVARVPPFEDFTDFEGGNLNGWTSGHTGWWTWGVHPDPSQGSVGKVTPTGNSGAGPNHSLYKVFPGVAAGRYMFQASLKSTHAAMTVDVGWVSTELSGNFQLTTGWRTYSVEALLVYESQISFFYLSIKGGGSLFIDNISITRIG
jgi:hypothetical protein